MDHGEQFSVICDDILVCASARMNTSVDDAKGTCLCSSVLITNLKIQHKTHCRECLCYRSFTVKSPY